jgi:Spore Coat Protein U domain
MKKSVLKAAAIAGFSVLGATGALAQSATQTITLNAFVNALCTINGTATGAAGETGTVVTSGTNASAQNLTLTSGGSYTVACSTPTLVTVTSTNDGIKANTPGGTTTNYINYTATVTQGVRTTLLTTAGGTTAPRVVTDAPGLTPGFNGSMTIGIAAVAASNLAPGSYSDTLTVTLLPQ